MPYLTYALDANGRLIHVDNVSTGLACECSCPHCDSKLIAKNRGNCKVHHFAHANGSDCAGAIESALHKMAKEILQEHKTIMLPPTQQDKVGKQVVFRNVESEVFDKELSLRPDCIGRLEKNRSIWIEFKRTHEVDIKKAGKIISARIDCIEIDLNSYECELDPTKVRNFIESNCASRKWIYNRENPHAFQVNRNDNISGYGFYSNYSFGQGKPRHLALDERNIIANLYDLSGINTNEHTYFCIACGKEVFINVDNKGNYSFSHVDRNTPCEEDYYLHESAKRMLLSKFNSQQKFDVHIPQLHLCEKGYQCSLFNEEYCSAEIPVPYDLKKHGYDFCEIEYKFPDERFSYDIVLMRNTDLKTAIIILINANACHIEPKNLKNRIIEVNISNEDDVFKLYEEPLRGDYIRFLNFEHKNTKTTSWKNIDRDILNFTLFSSGKYHLGIENCMSARKRSASYEMIFPNHTRNHQAIRQYAILRCYNNQKVLCLCEICRYLKNTIYDESICIRYKTKGTPRTPLATMPIKCPYFNLDKNLETELKQEALSWDFIEKDLTNQ